MRTYQVRRSTAQAICNASRTAAKRMHHLRRKGFFMALIPKSPRGTESTSTAIANAKTGEIPPSEAIPIPKQEMQGIMYIIRPIQVIRYGK